MTDGPTYYQHLMFNAPLSDRRANAIARRLATSSPADVLDVGCGWGELLLRVLACSPDSAGTGVDTDDAVLERARRTAVQRRLSERAEFVNQPAPDVSGPADLVLCVGSSHALSEDLPTALSALRERVRPRGRLLLGEGYWEPTGRADESLVWADVLALPGLGELVDRAVDAGFRPLYVERANADEWDAFESGFLADSEEWLMTHPEHDDAERERESADDHRRRWLHGYRDSLGFAYLTLGVPA